MAEPPKIVSAEASAVAHATATASASVRTNLALQHLLGAARFARHVCQVEQANAGKPFGPFFEELIHLATAAVTLSVASLEAFANELFADGTQRFPSLSKEILDAVWVLAEQRPFMEKYDLALTLHGVPPFDKGVPVRQNVDALVHLRNALIHFKPEWDDAQVKHKKLSARLRHKFALSPFLPAHEPLFPKGCMSHGCAEWAVTSVVGFLTDFQARLKMESRIDASNSGLRRTIDGGTLARYRGRGEGCYSPSAVGACRHGVGDGAGKRSGQRTGREKGDRAHFRGGIDKGVVRGCSC